MPSEAIVFICFAISNSDAMNLITLLSQIATIPIRPVLLSCALKFWQKENQGRELFLADYNYNYFVPHEVIEKFFESDMLGEYEKQTPHFYHHLFSLHHRATYKNSIF
jgi:hypothetical protein